MQDWGYCWPQRRIDSFMDKDSITVLRNRVINMQSSHSTKWAGNTKSPELVGCDRSTSDEKYADSVNRTSLETELSPLLLPAELPDLSKRSERLSRTPTIPKTPRQRWEDRVKKARNFLKSSWQFVWRNMNVIAIERKESSNSKQVWGDRPQNFLANQQGGVTTATTKYHTSRLHTPLFVYNLNYRNRWMMVGSLHPLSWKICVMILISFKNDLTCHPKKRFFFGWPVMLAKVR